MRVICVIDMQKDFIDGALGTAEAQAIVKPMAAFLKKHAASAFVAATRDTHGTDYMATNEGKHLPVPHCIKGSEGWQIDPRIAAAIPAAKTVDKPNFGISAGRWKRILQGVPVTEILLMGLCTDICVISNALALKTAYPEIPVKCVAGLCAGVTPESHEAALLTMKMCQVDLVSPEEV